MLRNNLKHPTKSGHDIDWAAVAEARGHGISSLIDSKQSHGKFMGETQKHDEMAFFASSAECVVIFVVVWNYVGQAIDSRGNLEDVEGELSCRACLEI